MNVRKQAQLFVEPVDIIQDNFEWQIRHLTFLLITATGINPERNNLTAMLGTGHEPDNIQAIRVWVRKQICCPSCARAIKLAHLYTRLNALLAVSESI